MKHTFDSQVLQFNICYVATRLFILIWGGGGGRHGFKQMSSVAHFPSATSSGTKNACWPRAPAIEFSPQTAFPLSVTLFWRQLLRSAKKPQWQVTVIRSSVKFCRSSRPAKMHGSNFNRCWSLPSASVCSFKTQKTFVSILLSCECNMDRNFRFRLNWTCSTSSWVKSLPSIHKWVKFSFRVKWGNTRVFVLEISKSSTFAIFSMDAVWMPSVNLQ